MRTKHRILCLVYVMVLVGLAGHALAQTPSFSKIADTDTPIPGGTGTIGRFGDPAISDGNVVFGAALGDDGYLPGIYSNVGGSLNRIADTSTAIPGGSGNFAGFSGDPSISGNNIAFAGAMSGDGAMPGIYSYVDGSLNLVADTNTLIPGGSSDFGTFLGSPAISGDHVAFAAALGYDGYLPGIYSDIGGSLGLVADTTTMVPGGTEAIGHFGDPSISGDRVAFLGGASDGSTLGIFLSSNGILEQVIGLSDVLDGKTIANLFMSQESLSGNQLTFRASFTNGDEGIYVATVPEPSAAILIGVGLSVLTICRRDGRL